MREIQAEKIRDTVAEMCQEANFDLGEDVMAAFKEAMEKEESETGRAILEQLIENAEIAAEERVPMCQDTGFAVIFLELGEDVKVVGGSLMEAIEEGVAKGYTEGYLRKSILEDPIKGGNTEDNTPPVVHTEIVPGDEIKLTVAVKGGGSENMSKIAMMKPADGIEGIKDFVVDTVREAGPNPCPPIVVGVGIGGTFEKVAQMAKKAAIRPVTERNSKPYLAEVEEEILQEINELGIGPAGMGGRTTALAVNIETFPRHIATFPVAVNIQCHSDRHKTRVI